MLAVPPPPITSPANNSYDTDGNSTASGTAEKNSTIKLFKEGILLSVAALDWVLVPSANRAFNWWLRPMSDGPRWVTAAGVALIVGLYVLSVAVFAWLI